MRAHKLFLIPVLAAGLAFSACTADVEEEGELPNVEVEGGNLPEVDVNPVDVDVGMTQDTTQVVTPDLDVDVNKRP